LSSFLIEKKAFEIKIGEKCEELFELLMENRRAVIDLDSLVSLDDDAPCKQLPKQH
jgi:hypothetical protein